MSAAIEFRDVSRVYGEVRAVDRVSLTVQAGEFFAMLGPSGSGKTTTLRMIAGFELPTAGRVELHGRDVTSVAPFERDTGATRCGRDNCLGWRYRRHGNHVLGVQQDVSDQARRAVQADRS